MRAKWVSRSAVGITVAVIVGIGWYASKNAAASTRAQMGLQKMERVQQHNSTQQKPGVPSLSGPHQGPLAANPHIVVGTDEIPNAGALSTAYHLTPDGPNHITGYIDEVHWNVVAGSLISNPSTGVVITYYVGNANDSPIEKIYRVPNSGPLTVVGFHGSMIDLSSAKGTATFDLTTHAVAWTPSSST